MGAGVGLLISCETTDKAAAPGFVGFEAWAFPLPTSGNFLIRNFLLMVVGEYRTVADPEYRKVQVRGSHPSKTTKGGAASVIVMPQENKNLGQPPGPPLRLNNEVEYILRAFCDRVGGQETRLSGHRGQTKERPPTTSSGVAAT